MKFAEIIFPKGTFNRQQTDGAYLDQTLGSNLDILARKIIKDLHFLGLVTGHDGVGNGKTTIATQVCTYLTNKINELHGVDNTFTEKNVHFSAKDLIKKSPQFPKYCVHLLDEGDDLTEHGLKELAKNLKKYFRKCRQLNQIIILILPSFFELPKFYALNRSNFLIDVKFMGEYDRGFFDFYGPKNKKLLYLKGKKEWNYDAQRSDFQGRFFSEYCFLPEVKETTKKYLAKKKRDLTEQEEEEAMPLHQVIKQVKVELFKQAHERLPNIYIKDLSHAFGVSERTGSRWLGERPPTDTRQPPTYNNNIIKDDEIVDEERELSAEPVAVPIESPEQVIE